MKVCFQIENSVLKSRISIPGMNLSLEKQEKKKLHIEYKNGKPTMRRNLFMLKKHNTIEDKSTKKP